MKKAVKNLGLLFFLMIGKVSFAPVDEVPPLRWSEEHQGNIDRDGDPAFVNEHGNVVKKTNTNMPKKPVPPVKSDQGSSSKSSASKASTDVDMSNGPAGSKKETDPSRTRDHAADYGPDASGDKFDTYFSDLGKGARGQRPGDESRNEEDLGDYKQLLSNSKTALFDSFSHLKFDSGIQDFKKLSRADIEARVSTKVDAISEYVICTPDQEKILKDIMTKHLLSLQDKLKNKRIVATPEEVARVLFDGVDNDTAWNKLKFTEKQRDALADHVMRQEDVVKGSLLEDFLKLCSKMSKKAEDSATDARLAGQGAKDSIVGKFKVGGNRMKAAFMVAANPCILSGLLLGIVGEFLSRKL